MGGGEGKGSDWFLTDWFLTNNHLAVEGLGTRLPLIYFTDDTWKRERDEVIDWLLQEKIIGKSNVRCLQVPGRDGIV